MKRAGFLLLAILLCALPSVAESPLVARLHAAAAVTSIDTPGLRPWHLKMNVQLFDAKGTATEQGTVEEWWAGPEMSRVTYTMPSYTVTQLHNKGGLYLTKSQIYESKNLDDLLRQVVHPMPQEAEIDAAKPDLHKEKFGNVAFDCIMLDEPLASAGDPPLGLFPTYCLDSGKDSLKFTTELGSMVFGRNSTGLFQGQSVAVEVAGKLNDVEVIAGHVSVLSTMQVVDSDFVPGADMQPVTANAASFDKSTTAGQIVSDVNPVYPEAAEQNNISGVVAMHAVIGRDGHVQSLHLVSATNPNLAIAAVAAAQQRIYRPFTSNGAPIEMGVTIEENFTIRH